MCLAVIGVELNGAPAQLFSLKVSRTCTLSDAREGTNHAFPGVQAARRLTLAADMLSRVKLGLNRRDDALGNLIL